MMRNQSFPVVLVIALLMVLDACDLGVPVRPRRHEGVQLGIVFRRLHVACVATDRAQEHVVTDGEQPPSRIGIQRAMKGFEVSTVGMRWKLMSVSVNCGQMYFT